MTVLITGATGFVGRAVVLALLGRGHGVTAFVRTPGKARDLEAAGASLAVGDMLDPSTYRGLVAGVDAVVHAAQYATAGRLTRKRMAEMQAADETMTETLARACLDHDARLVYTSGCFNYGDHGSSWGSSSSSSSSTTRRR